MPVVSSMREIQAGTVQKTSDLFYNMFDVNKEADERDKKIKGEEDTSEADERFQSRYDMLKDNVQSRAEARREGGRRAYALGQDGYGNKDSYDVRAAETKLDPIEFANNFKKELIEGRYKKSQERVDSRFDVAG